MFNLLIISFTQEILAYIFVLSTQDNGISFLHSLCKLSIYFYIILGKLRNNKVKVGGLVQIDKVLEVIAQLQRSYDLSKCLAS